MKKTTVYEFTPDDVADYVRDICRDFEPLTLKNVGIVLGTASEFHKNTDAGIIAFCENREAKAADAPEKPALSRFLPVRPDDVPAPPDGWVYVGRGHGKSLLSDEIDIGMLFGEGWNCGVLSRNGFIRGMHYAIRWTAPEDVWHRFGLIFPDEGGGWIPHTPGNAMPCYGDLKIDVLYRNGIPCGFSNDFAHTWSWDDGHDQDDIIGWRPALAEVRS